jgi:hypothetical protein
MARRKQTECLRQSRHSVCNPLRLVLLVQLTQVAYIIGYTPVLPTIALLVLSFLPLASVLQRAAGGVPAHQRHDPRL